MPQGTSAIRKLASAEQYRLVTKDDDDDLPDGIADGLLVGTAGTANLMEPGGDTQTDVPLVAGYNPIKVKRVLTGGTADDIWALYN